MEQTVQFGAGVQAMAAAGVSAWLEIGPKPTLLGMASESVGAGPHRWIPSLRDNQAGWTTLLGSVAQLYAAGVKVDWAALDRPYRRKRVHLPAYPFQRERHWVKAQPAPSAAIAHEASAEEGTLTVAWRPQPWPQSSSEIAAGRWVILTDQRGIGTALAAALERSGGRCEIVEVGEAFAQHGDRRWSVEPTSKRDFEQLWAALADTREEVRGIVHLFSLDASGGRQAGTSEHGLDLERVQHLGPASALSLVQGLLAARGATVQTPALWFITAGAAATQDDRTVDVAGAPLWGLATAIALEHPELWGGLVDLPAQTDEALSDLADALAAHLIDPNREDRVALRATAGEAAAARRYQRHVQRLARGEARLDTGAASPSWSAEGTYLITGGLGALGMHTARWLVDRGARHLALLSRRGPASPGAAAAVAELEQRGAASVRVLCADVASADGMREALTTIGETMPPLVGVLHTAGVLDDGVLLHQSGERLAKVMAAKVAGAWNLHVLTQGSHLRHFVLFSSLASVLGSAGQGNYAAANAFLDALAHHRRAHGLPALSVNWGAWAGEGMAMDVAARQARVGLRGMAPERALRALDRLVRTELPQAAVADVDWAVFRTAYEAFGPRPLLAELDGAAAQAQRSAPRESEAHPWARRLREAPSSARQKLLQAWLSEEVAKVLGFKDGASAVGVRRGFFDMGMDSLMAVELRNRVQAQL
ncbi:MAG TPA: SDR family NAD(P)-dependent oxidoreductase, partial [Bacilli bacterium]|nr:SDR family NAD(P)-dependent oxidoreductase [Bacilli bacterium]